MKIISSLSIANSHVSFRYRFFFPVPLYHATKLAHKSTFPPTNKTTCITSFHASIPSANQSPYYTFWSTQHAAIQTTTRIPDRTAVAYSFVASIETAVATANQVIFKLAHLFSSPQILSYLRLIFCDADKLRSSNTFDSSSTLSSDSVNQQNNLSCVHLRAQQDSLPHAPVEFLPLNLAINHMRFLQRNPLCNPPNSPPAPQDNQLLDPLILPTHRHRLPHILPYQQKAPQQGHLPPLISHHCWSRSLQLHRRAPPMAL